MPGPEASGFDGSGFRFDYPEIAPERATEPMRPLTDSEATYVAQVLGGVVPQTFLFEGEESPITFVETQAVKDGVTCDVYTFEGDTTKDLGIIRVSPGQRTPLQRVLQGVRTVEGFITGSATLVVTEAGGQVTEHHYDQTSEPGAEVDVAVGQLMQWVNEGDSDLFFYEVCMPPYATGRYEDLADL